MIFFQRGLRQRDSAECGDQEAESALPERDPRKEGLQRVQTHEARQPQKRKQHLWFIPIAAAECCLFISFLLVCKRRKFLGENGSCLVSV
jgi:hypothetical protein